MYKITDVEYTVSNTHRRFLKDGKIVLSIPLSSVLIKDNAGVTAQIINTIKTEVENNTINNKTTIIQSEDNFTEGLVIGGIIGATLF